MTNMNPRKFCIILLGNLPVMMTHRAWFEYHSDWDIEWFKLTIHEARQKLREMMTERKKSL